MKILQAALAEPWAITAEGLELVLSVAARENEISVEALEAYRAEHVPTSERLTRRGSIAILEARGPLFNRANLFTAISGATSYDVMRRDLQAALDDPSARAVVIRFDTPGGAVADADELAKAIRAGKAIKPIVAYVGNMAASAGYWLASQASEIVISETAILGSIGVRAAYQDTSARDAEKGVVEFISSQSPGKRTDLASDEGRGRVQRTIDALADVFIATVAEGRGVKPDDVIAKFGGGDVLIGSAAVAAGMADRIGSFEAVIAELARRGPAPISQSKTGMSEITIAQAEYDAAIANARTEGEKTGAASARERINAIKALDEAKDRPVAAENVAMNTDMTVDQAKAFLAAVPVETEPQADGLVRLASDAPGGLVQYDPTLEPQSEGGLVQFDAPNTAPATKAERDKAMWGRVTSKINSDA